MKKLLLFLSFLPLFSIAQRQTKDTTVSSTVGGTLRTWNMRYTNNNALGDSTTVFIYMGGKGEVGTNILNGIKYGPHSYMPPASNIWDGGIQLGNGTVYPTYVSLQQLTESTPASITAGMIQVIKTRFKVKQWVAMVVSNGGVGLGSLIGFEAFAGDPTWKFWPNVYFDVQGQAPGTTGSAGLPYPQKMGHWAALGGKMFSIDQTGTGQQKPQTRWQNILDSTAPIVNGYLVWTNYGDGSHSYFDRMYDPRITDWSLANPETQARRPSNGGVAARPPAAGQNSYQILYRMLPDTSIPGTGNRPPVANAGGNKNIQLPTNSVSLNSSASYDPENAAMSYLWTKLTGTGGTITNPANPITTFTGLTEGTYSLRLTVTDNMGQANSQDFLVTVAAAYVNQPPAVNAGIDQSIKQPASSVTLSGTATSPNPGGSVVSYAWTKGGAGGSYTITSPSSASTTVTGLPLGSHTLVLSATDNNGLIGQDSVMIVVQPANSGVDRSVKVYLLGSSATLANSINDGAWNPWYVGTAQAAGIQSGNFNYETGEESPVNMLLSHSQGINDNLSSYVTSTTKTPTKGARYSSFSGNASRTLTIKGLDGNRTYDLEFFSSRNFAGQNTRFTINGVLKIQTSSSNFDSTIIYQGITPVDGQIVVTLAKEASFNYINWIIVTEKNSSGGGNINPVAQAGSDTTLKLPTTGFIRTGSGSDADGTITGYEWSQVSGPNTAGLGGSSTATVTISGLIRGTYVFRLQVTDNSGGTSTDDITVNLYNATEPPVVNAGPDQTTASNSVTLSATASDPDGTITDVQWIPLSYPEGANPIFQTGNALTTVVNGLTQNGTYFFGFSGKDNDGNSTRDTMQVVVNAPTPGICQANAGPDQSFVRGEKYQVVLDGSASIGGATPLYSWRRTTVVDYDYKGLVKGGNNVKADAMMLQYRDNGTDIITGYEYELTVDNQAGCVSKDTMKVTIAWGPMPVQSPDGNAGWHYATAADTLAIGLMGNPGLAKIGDVVVPGAHANSFVGGKNSVSIQASSNMKLGPGQKILIRASPYKFVTIAVPPGNVRGTHDNPVIITNYGGQVKAEYMTLTDMIGIRATGEYKPGVSGHPGFVGKQNGLFSWNHGTFGIYVNNNWSSLASQGFRVHGDTTRVVELDHIEIANGNFTGYQIKEDGGPNEYDSIYTHDMVVRFIHSEARYDGTTASGYVHGFNNMEHYNNQFSFIGGEGSQDNNNNFNVNIHNNVIAFAAINRRSPFNVGQNNGIQLTVRGDHNFFQKNMIMGAGSQGSNFFAADHVTSRRIGDSVLIMNNLFYGNSGRYMWYSNLNNLTTGPGTLKIVIKDNYFGGNNYTDDYYAPGNLNSSNSPNAFSGLGTGPIIARNNVLDSTKEAFSIGTLYTVSGLSRVGKLPAPRFANSGWPQDFDYSSVQRWTDTVGNTYHDENFTGRTNYLLGDPVYFQQGDIVEWLSRFYKSKTNNNTGHMPRIGGSDDWEQLFWTDSLGGIHEVPPDDWRLVSGDFYLARGMGLLDSVSVVGNVPPVVSVGDSVTITLPLATVNLTGTASDADGVVSFYEWTKLSGPTAGQVSNPAAGTTTAYGLSEGTYIFQLKVTDNKGAIATANYKVIVKPYFRRVKKAIKLKLRIVG